MNTRRIKAILKGLILVGVMTGLSSYVLPSDGGGVHGMVTYKAKAPTPRKLKVDKDLNVCAKHPIYSEELLVSKNGGLKNVVVQVIGAKGALTIPKGKNRLSIRQKGCQFIPHLLVIPTGARINILNEDGIAHNIHTLSVENPSFNLQQPGNKRRIVTKKSDFAVPEIIPVKCDIHGWMKAWLVVVDHPFHAITDDQGAFRIGNIPPGTYTIQFWHETLGKQSQKVTIKSGSETEVNVLFKPKK